MGLKSFNRRQLIKAGLFGSAGLLLTELGFNLVHPQDRQKLLGATDVSLFSALAIALLGDSLPSTGQVRHEALEQIGKNIEGAIAGLQPAIQEELMQLLTLLKFPLSRKFLLGISADWTSSTWSQINQVEVEHFLQEWRQSRFLLFRSGYQALHQIVIGSWFASEKSWEFIGYSGPPPEALAAQND